MSAILILLMATSFSLNHHTLNDGIVILVRQSAKSCCTRAEKNEERP
jgi:hypothetical protein